MQYTSFITKFFHLAVLEFNTIVTTDSFDTPLVQILNSLEQRHQTVKCFVFRFQKRNPRKSGIIISNDQTVVISCNTLDIHRAE
ncbi:hypothetical protein HanIR_Chr17g0876381 [Helianthus annuus]|nr:hypothetical protein HanIR_Chr17g0876381 [Helianthus annuus]